MSFGNTSVEGLLSANYTSQGNNSSIHQATSSICTGRGLYWPIHGSLILFILFIFAANCTVIMLTIWKETLRTVSNMFLFSLAISDLVFGSLGIPLFLVCQVKTTLQECVASLFLARFTAISSVFHLLVIACDCYTVILYSMKYPSLVTKQRATFVIVMIWLLAFVSSSLQFTWYSSVKELTELNEEKIRKDRIYFLFLIIAFFFAPLLGMVYMYGQVLAISIRHIFAFRRRQKNLDQPVSSIAHDLRGTFILVTMMLIFISCWLPFFLVMLQDQISEKFFVVPEWSFCIILYLRFIPPLANPVLCAFCKQDYRRAWRSLTRRYQWPTSIRFYSLGSTSGTRERTHTASLASAEKTNNVRSSADSMNIVAMEV